MRVGSEMKMEIWVDMETGGEMGTWTQNSIAVTLTEEMFPGFMVNNYDSHSSSENASRKKSVLRTASTAREVGACSSF